MIEIRPSLAALGRLLAERSAAPGAVVVAYHDVSENRSAGSTVSASLLGSHIVTLRRLGMRIVPLRQLAARLSAGDSIDGLAVLTFDDALVGVVRHGLPVLDRFDAAATVFVVSAALGRTPPWWPESDRVMTADELDTVLAAGHTVGSHTRHHPSLPACTDDQLEEELVGSRRDLEQRAGGIVDAIAYPSGHHDRRVRRAAASAGYRLGFTFLNGRVEADVDPLRLPRLTAGAHLSPARLAYHLLRPPSSWPDHQVEAVGAGP